MAFIAGSSHGLPVTTQPEIEGRTGAPVGIIMAEQIYTPREHGFFHGLGQLARGQTVNAIHVRDLAFDALVADLAREAERRGADAVVSVQFERTHSGGGNGAITHRISAFGTAIKFGEPRTDPITGPERTKGKRADVAKPTRRRKQRTRPWWWMRLLRRKRAP